MHKSFIKILSLLLIIGLNWTGLSAIGRTLAYYLDNEDSNDNLFQATILDFSVTNKHIEDFIGMEALSEIEFASVVTKKTGSLNIQYEVNTEKISGDDNFCDALEMKVEHNGVEKHDGSLLSFSAATTTQLGTWEFELNLPVSTTNVPHGAECDVDLVFRGWRSDVVSFEESGFTDEERIQLRLTSRTIVLNEFLPNPDGVAYGFDFGDDNSNMPQGEWVEIYNNSDSSFDLAEWYIKDSLESDTNKIMITNANTAPIGTIVGPKNWLVVYMNKAVLNNDGDTVRLFDNSNTLIDSYTYTSHDYCELEPTPGDENSDTTNGGNCGEVPTNKSYARIPDGIGYWVDPIPTPGRMNVLEGENVFMVMVSPILLQINEIILEEPSIIDEPIIEEPVLEEQITETEETTTTEEETAITTEEVATTEETTEIIETTEPSVIEEPAAIENDASEEMTVVENEEQPAIEETPSVIEETPPTIEETPSVIEETPPAIEETPPIIEQEPVQEEPAPPDPAPSPDGDSQNADQ